MEVTADDRIPEISAVILLPSQVSSGPSTATVIKTLIVLLTTLRGSRSGAGLLLGLAFGRMVQLASRADCMVSTFIITLSAHALRPSIGPSEVDGQVVSRSAGQTAIPVFYRTAPLCIAFLGPFSFTA